jgi:HK97 family phage major capsid protein
MAQPIGLTSKEVQSYSFVRAIDAIASGNLAKAGFEMECSREVHARGKFDPVSGNSFAVPDEILKRRDLTAGVLSAGGALVGTENLSFIEMLRNRSVVMSSNAMVLGGLTGNVVIPRQSGASTAYWLSTEATAITESQATLGQLALTPKTAGAMTEISRLLILQSSPDVERLVRTDLAKTVALAVDSAALNGTGASGQPLGLLNTSGIGSVTGASIDYADMIEFQSDVAAANALDEQSCTYVTTPTVAGLLMARVKFASTASPIWEGNLSAGTVLGYRAISSNQVPAGTLIFGDFSAMVIAEWGTLQIDVNPFAAFSTGIVGVRAMYSVDVGVRYPGAFSVATSVT